MIFWPSPFSFKLRRFFRRPVTDGYCKTFLLHIEDQVLGPSPLVANLRLISRLRHGFPPLLFSFFPAPTGSGAVNGNPWDCSWEPPPPLRHRPARPDCG